MEKLEDGKSKRKEETTKSSKNIKLCWKRNKCKNQSCQFRHPGSARPFVNPTFSYTNAISSNDITSNVPSNCDSLPKLPTQMVLNDNTVDDKEFLMEWEAKALEMHNNSILTKQMENMATILTDGGMETEEQNLCTVKNKNILQYQINQLTKQLEVFKSMKSRAYSTLEENSQELSQLIGREIFRLESSLPVFAKRLEIEKEFAGNSRVIIIHGQTGSGKSTQIPQYVADHPNFYGKRIICTQPRKIAAESLANRVAFEYAGGSCSSALGQHVGFHVGGRKVAAKNCRIEFVTEGVMLERILRNDSNAFNNVGCIIIDEAHERSITCDILLGSFKKEDPRWKDILIIVMSATIDLNLFRNYFQGVPVLEIEGRTFPVTIIYEPLEDTSDIQIRSAVSKCAFQIHMSCRKEPGDILCFLPGQEDVQVAKAEFENYIAALTRPVDCLTAKALVLFGKQDPEQQACVFENLPKHIRKVIFSTDLAETSVTIDGVKFVVDSGVKKEVVYDPKRNISSLKVNTISKSSAIQRAGRSGRTQPGECHRLYSVDDYEKMYVNTAPEIFRKQLSVAVLTLREMNIDPVKFDWISAPSKESLAAAEEELRMLNAIDCDNKATELGKLISRSQLDPKLARMIYAGCKKGFGLAALTLASVITVSDIFFWRGNNQGSKSESRDIHKKFQLPEGDFVTMYRVFEEWLNIHEGRQTKSKENDTEAKEKQFYKKEAHDWCIENRVNGKAMNLALSTRRDFTPIFKISGIWKSCVSQNGKPSNEELQKIIFAGYFLQTARLIRTRNVNSTFQYYALHSDITGSLSFNSAFLNTVQSSPETPQWIVYDRIFRLTVTIFPGTSAIKENWLHEESEEFYEACVEKLKSVPTESITKFLSQVCLHLMVGKFFCNLESLENELGCSIMADRETGQFTAFCSVSKKPDVEYLLNEKILKIICQLQSETIEEEYLGGSRVVIGQGYEIKEILFPREFSTVYIRNLPGTYDEKAVERLLNYTKVNQGLLNIRIIKQNTVNDAIVRFESKSAAKLVCDKLNSSMFLQSHNITASPKFGQRKGVTQGISSRLKLSWASGPSTGIATIWFNTPQEANMCIENFKNIFPESTIASVLGERSMTTGPLRKDAAGNSNGRPLPPVKTKLVQLGLLLPRQRSCRYRFDLEKIIEMRVDIHSFEYIITVSDIPQDVDEYEIIRRIQNYQPKWVKVKRVSEKKELTEDEKKSKLDFIAHLIEKDGCHISDFFDSQHGRAGMYIHFKNNSLAKEAYNKRISYNLMADKPYGQPHRLEIEYIHQMSVHVDLYQFLEQTLVHFKSVAKTKGVTVTQRFPKNSRCKFVYLSCRSDRQANILWVQDKLNAITTPTKFVSENSHLLFTWTGKFDMDILSEKTFIHCNRKNNWIWVYGSEDVKQEVIRDLGIIVTGLSSLEIIDKPIVLNKKEVNVNGKEGAMIAQVCTANNIPYFHFHGNTLYLTGSESEVKNVEAFLDEKCFKREFVKRKYSYEEDLRECGICFCRCDEKFIVLSLCSHIFCLECIEPMFGQQPPPFPIRCPRCEIPIALNDILRSAPQGSLRKILEVAILQYQQNNSTDVRLCPTLGCEQLLSYSSRTTGKVGGEFLFCDECMTTYCIVCSAKLFKPVKSHEDDSCEDVQSGISIEVSKYVTDIQENILNLNCPKCKTPFFDFDGCAAVACGSCDCNFCGLCLRDCGTSEETHTHVRQCPKQTNKGQFFVDKKTLDLAHKDLRIQNIKNYIVNTGDLSTSTLLKVLNALREDLQDLEIDVNLFAPNVSIANN